MYCIYIFVIVMQKDIILFTLHTGPRSFALSESSQVLAGGKYKLHIIKILFWIIWLKVLIILLTLHSGPNLQSQIFLQEFPKSLLKAIIKVGRNIIGFIQVKWRIILKTQPSFNQFNLPQYKSLKCHTVFKVGTYLQGNSCTESS